jgi:hypothetical protein
MIVSGFKVGAGGSIIPSTSTFAGTKGGSSGFMGGISSWLNQPRSGSAQYAKVNVNGGTSYVPVQSGGVALGSSTRGQALGKIMNYAGIVGAVYSML